MDIIDSIKATISAELELFDKTFVAALETDNPILEGVYEYIYQRSGKRLRPTLAILSAKLMSSEVNMSTIHVAIALELLHTASLVHDDVIDNTFERRNSQSVNARWGNKVAVLSGDYMLAAALAQVALIGNIKMLHPISFVGQQLTDGELLQLNISQQSKISEAEYFRIIQRKTASLFSVCMEVGALSVHADSASIDHLKKYGEYLGFCFQIRDDIFDYYQNADIGKPTGNDVGDGKVTLPLIHALENAGQEEKKKIITWINFKKFSRENIDYITRFALKHGGVEYARSRMEEFREKAIRELDGFPDSIYKQALIDCVEFAVTRTK
jgi:octaprenyl-diphosphate synthase